MPSGISRLAALVVPVAALMPLLGTAAQAPTAAAETGGLRIVEVAGDFVIRRASNQLPAPASVRLGNTIHLDRALIARPARNTQQGGVDEIR